MIASARCTQGRPWIYGKPCTQQLTFRVAENPFALADFAELIAEFARASLNEGWRGMR
jgi:hypothetical protein